MTITSNLDAGISIPRPDRPKVFLSLQAGRGVAALMVVFYHCEDIFSLEKYWHWTRHYLYFGARGVDFFFVLSGIVMLHAHKADIGRPQRLTRYAWRRIRRIYPTYWIVLFSVVPLYFIFPLFGDGSQRAGSVIFSSIVLLPFTRTEAIIPVAWTLFHEIMFYLVFSFLLVGRRVGIAALSLWMIASIVSLSLSLNPSPLAFYISPLHLLFGLGLLSSFIVRRFTFNGLPLVVLGSFAFIACSVFDNVVRPHGDLLPLAFGFFFALLAIGFMQLEKARHLGIPKSLIFLGEASYSLYLIHYLVLSLSAKLVYPLWLRHPTPMGVPLLVLVCVALSAGLGLHVYVERPLMRRLQNTFAR